MARSDAWNDPRIETVAGDSLATAEKADTVRNLLKRDGATQPFWTTTGGERPFIKIECQDLKMLHALDDFLRSCVRDAKL